MGNGTADDDIGIAVRGKLEGTVALELFAQLLGDGVGQAGLKGLVNERVDANRAFTGFCAVGRAELIAGATEQDQDCREGENSTKVTTKVHWETAAISLAVLY